MLQILFAAFITLYLFYEFYWKRRNFPPGPTPLPIVGNLLEVLLKSPGYEAYQRWKRDFGAVHTYWICGLPIVSIADYEIIKETFIKDGENLTLHTLRDFGMGRNIMEERVMIEVDFLLERLATQKENVYMQNEFDIAVGSVINNILFGYRFDEEHLHEFDLLKAALRQLVYKLQNPLIILASCSPIIKSLPFINGFYNRLLADRDVLYGFVRKQIAEKRKQINYGVDSSEDFVESYLKEWERKKGTKQEEFYFEQQLEAVIFDIWTAGMETTSNTLTWSIVYIMNNPDVQTKIHEELDRVIRSDRKITMSDKNSLPYTNAVISEVQRLANLVPQNLCRLNSEEVVVKGYKIPAGTIMVPQICSVLYDEKIFPDPYKFDPNRFLKPDGSYQNRPELVPFSVGKRQCAGEGMAKLELYSFLANLFQRFKISCKTLPSLEKTMGTVVTSKPYYCDFEERHK
ncbi:unnamed protein product, partial [Mesorhabditis belari]|uniref:CYtochrome P450 family n=1 Tax=Mesorhabditis belari TaxID=2138241 RepID=A0AAF3F3C1_9BILA